MLQVQGGRCVVAAALGATGIGHRLTTQHRHRPARETQLDADVVTLDADSLRGRGLRRPDAPGLSQPGVEPGAAAVAAVAERQALCAVHILPIAVYIDVLAGLPVKGQFETLVVMAKAGGVYVAELWRDVAISGLDTEPGLAVVHHSLQSAARSALAGAASEIGLQRQILAYLVSQIQPSHFSVIRQGGLTEFVVVLDAHQRSRRYRQAENDPPDLPVGVVVQRLPHLHVIHKNLERFSDYLGAALEDHFGTISDDGPEIGVKRAGGTRAVVDVLLVGDGIALAGLRPVLFEPRQPYHHPPAFKRHLDPGPRQRPGVAEIAR